MKMILQNKNIKKDYFFLSEDKKIFVGYDEDNDGLIAKPNSSAITNLEVVGDIDKLSNFIKEIKKVFDEDVVFDTTELKIFWNYWQKESNGNRFIENSSKIKSTANKLRLLGYNVIVDPSKPSIKIFDKEKNIKFQCSGNQADEIITEFEISDDSKDVTLSIEDWLLSLYLFGKVI